MNVIDCFLLDTTSLFLKITRCGWNLYEGCKEAGNDVIGHPVLAYSLRHPGRIFMPTPMRLNKHALAPSHPMEIKMGREWGGNGSVLLFFITALLSYKWHTLNWNYIFKVNNLISLTLVEPSALWRCWRNISPKVSHVPLWFIPHFQQSPGHHLPAFVTRFLYKWDHTECTVQWASLQRYTHVILSIKSLILLFSIGIHYM